MKKFFTLIAAVAMAASMNAQGTYAVQAGDNVNPGDQITSVENITLTYMENAGKAFKTGKAMVTGLTQTSWLMYLVGAMVSWYLVLSQQVVFIKTKKKRRVL